MYTLNHLHQAFEMLQEQHSSFRDSILLSPYCPNYNPKSQESDQQNLLEYIKPHLNRTQAKKIKRMRTSGIDERKKTQPDRFESEEEIDHNLSKMVEQLKRQITKKDEKIAILQKALEQHNRKTRISTIGDLMENSEVKINRHKRLATQIDEDNFNKRIANFKKQIIFLSHNNQQLFEEVKQLTGYSQKLKKVLSKALKYGQQLQMTVKQLDSKVKQLQNENMRLLMQKKQTIKDYEEEMKIFIKMKKVWDNREGTEIVSGRSRKKRPTQKRGILKD